MNRLFKIFLAIFFISSSALAQENRFGAVPLSEAEYLQIPKIENNAGQLGFASSIPSSYSLENYVPEVKDQVGGTCTGFAFVYYGLSTQYNYKFNLTNNVDKRGHAFDPYFVYNLIDNPYDTAGACTDGNFLWEVLKNLKDKGAKKRFYSPFLKCNSSIFSDDFLEYTKPYALSSYSAIDIDKYLYYNVRRKISQNKPVIIGLHVTDTFANGIPFNGLTSTDIHYLSRYSTENYHAVAVIGYDDNKLGGAFRIVNSWGKEWGDNGYFWMKYDDFNKFVREAYIMNISSNNIEISQADNYLYKRKLLNSNEFYEGQVDRNNNPNGIGIYSYNDDNNERINVIGEWSSEGGKDGHYVFINESQTLSLLYKSDNLIEYNPVLGFSGGKVDDSVIDQDMFSEYMNSYGKGDPPVRRKAKGVPRIKPIN